MDIDEWRTECRVLLGDTWADYLQQFPEVPGKERHQLAFYSNVQEYLKMRGMDKKCWNQEDVEKTHNKNLKELKTMQLRVINAIHAQLPLEVLSACRKKIEDELVADYRQTPPIAPVDAEKDLAFIKGRFWGARLTFWTGLVTTVASLWSWFKS